MTPHDDFITHGDLRLAIRDFGGSGVPLLLLHGLGGTVDSWNRFAAALTDRHRVVAVDLRGHGRSGDADWIWESAADDLDAVTAGLGLGRPVVIGESLGGMLAAVWAGRGGRALGVISIDGHRSPVTDARHYADMDPEVLAADRAALTELFDLESLALDRPLSAEQVAMFPSRAVTHVEGAPYIRPGRRLAEQVRHSDVFGDAVARFVGLDCPALILAAAQDPARMPERFHPLMNAYRAGLRRDLDRLSAEDPNLTVEWRAAGHDMLVNAADELADRCASFVDGLS